MVKSTNGGPGAAKPTTKNENHCSRAKAVRIQRTPVSKKIASPFYLYQHKS
jgi:hypothetical protein